MATRMEESTTVVNNRPGNFIANGNSVKSPVSRAKVMVTISPIIKPTKTDEKTIVKAS